MGKSVAVTPRGMVFGALFLVCGVLWGGCGGGPASGPGEIRWDRDICDRCRMALSDHHCAAQVRGGPAGGRSRLYKFDDFGCAVMWLQDREWGRDPATEIWVTDAQSGAWLPARSAFFTPGFLTPMDFGLGARPDSIPGAVAYPGAVRIVRQRDAALQH